MKIAIIGAGAMGSLYGAKLSQNKNNQVFLLDVWQDHIDKINNNGLSLEWEGDTSIYSDVKASSRADEVGVCDLVIVFVKSTLTAKAIESNKALFGESDCFESGTVGLTLQNGLGNVDEIKKIIGEENVIAGTTAHGATMLEAGCIRHAGKGKTIIGEISGKETERIKHIANLLNDANMETEISENVIGLIWDKLMVNVGINAIVGIAKITNGELLEHPELVNILEKAVAEAKTVADKKGVKLSYADPITHAKDVCKATSKNKASMLQDLLKGNKTEIDMINGAIVREAEFLGMEAPVNYTLTNIIKFLE